MLASRGCSAGVDAHCKVAWLEAYARGERLLDRSRCSLPGCSVRGYARSKAARLVAFLVASTYFMLTCTQYELILDMTRVCKLGLIL
ncbi:hypothetical protein COP2_001805 [Malus domestica]